METERATSRGSASPESAARETGFALFLRVISTVDATTAGAGRRRARSPWGLGPLEARGQAEPQRPGPGEAAGAVEGRERLEDAGRAPGREPLVAGQGQPGVALDA